MVSMQDRLRCPHCGVELEVNTVISRLSLRWLGKPAASARPGPTIQQEDGPIEGAVIEPAPRIEDKGT